MLFLNENAHFWSTQRQARRQPKPVTQLSSPDPQPSSAPFAWSARGPQTRVPTLFGPSPAEGPAKLPSLFGAAHARSPKFLLKPNSPGPFPASPFGLHKPSTGSFSNPRFIRNKRKMPFFNKSKIKNRPILHIFSH